MAALGPSSNALDVSETPPPGFDSWFEGRVPGIPAAAARAALELCDRGAPAAFVAAYRRDATGGLDARAVRRVVEARELVARVRSRQTIVLESIERHATLSPELRERILATLDPDALEDLYHPYRQQKKNRAAAAREAGLSPLADWIWDCGHGRDTPQPGQTLELWAFTFRNEEKAVPDAKSAIEGARDILVERLAGDPELRALVRRVYFEEGFVHAAKTAKAKPGSRFEPYFAFHEKVSSLREPRQTHRYLALKRGQAEDELQLSIGGGPGDEGFEERLLAAFEAAACSVPESPGAEVLRHAGRIALKNDVRTSIENEVHRTLTEAAYAFVATGFAESARRRLLEGPFGPRPVIGVDPGARGCRLAAVGASGELEGSLALELATDEQKAAAPALLAGFARERSAAALAVGDGAGGRDFELMARAALRAAGLELEVALVSEAGASGWAASDAARAELPDAEPGLRAAVSIARRFQDPLAELVKLDPKQLGAGQHHHDVPHALLHRAIDAVIEDVVASVGVDVNSAPRALLARVPGLSQAAAAAIVEHRTAHGRFATRRALLDAGVVDESSFEHAAGFLRVRDGASALDATAVHPERYAALEAFAARHGKTASDLLGEGAALVRDAAELDAELGPLTRADVAKALAEAGRDPRPPHAPFAFREDVRSIDQLKPGMECPGVVTNVTSFGVFVDVGARQDGLVHVSQLPRARAGGEATPLSPGDRVEVRVLKVDLEKKQVSLTMKPRPEPRAKPKPRPRPQAAVRPAGDRPASREAPGPRSQRPPARPPRKPAEARPEPPGGRERPRPPSAGKPAPGPAARKPEPRRPAFNNPFAVLADLKKR
jgi:uncharacterized protein